MKIIRRLALFAALPAAASGRLEVIGAGFGRTGTASLREALNMLGYKTYHMKEIVHGNERHVDEWMSFFNGEKDISEIVDVVYHEQGFTAAVDHPSCNAWPDLAKLYPDAKIILTERSTPETYWESASETILIPSFPIRFLSKVSPFWGKFMAFSKQMWKYTFPSGFEHARHVTLDDKHTVIQAYLQNSEKAKNFEDGRRTLVFNVAQGWEPLCAFLGKDVPDVPFPHVNSKWEFQMNLMKLLLTMMVPPTLAVLLLVYLLFRAFAKTPKDEGKKKSQ